MKHLKQYKLFEYKATEGQLKAVDKWLSKKGISDKSVINRFFTLFPKLKKKDIFSYKTYDELLTALKDAESWETSAEKKKKLKKDIISKQFEDKLIILALTPDATRFYGAGTTWCTSMRDSNYHWLLHRIIGVEFILINNSLKDTDNKHKLSIHINWDKKYITIFDANNKIEFDGIKHEYWNIEDLKEFLNNDNIFEWMMKEFEETKRDAPSFIPSLIGKLIKDKEIDKFFNITLEAGNPIYDLINDYIDVDDFNSLEYYYLIDQIIPIWKKLFIPWFSQLKYNNIYKLLETIRKRLLDKTYSSENSLTDHVFMSETFLAFLKEQNLLNDIYKIPLIFDSEDEEWIERLAEALVMDEDELLDRESEILDYYDTLKNINTIGKNRFNVHIDILKEFFKNEL